MVDRSLNEILWFGFWLISVKAYHRIFYVCFDDDDNGYGALRLALSN